MNKIGFERKKDSYLSNCVSIIWSDSLEPLRLTTTRYMPDKTYYDRRHPDTNTAVIYIRITQQSMWLYRITINGDSAMPHLQGYLYLCAHKGSAHSHGNNDNGYNGYSSGSASNGNIATMSYFEHNGSFLSKVKTSNKFASAIPTTRFDDLLIVPLFHQCYHN